MRPQPPGRAEPKRASARDAVATSRLCRHQEHPEPGNGCHGGSPLPVPEPASFSPGREQQREQQSDREDWLHDDQAPEIQGRSLHPVPVGFSSPPTLPGFNPTFTIKPGQSSVIDLTITPSQDGTAGTVVSGTLYVDVLAAFNEIQESGVPSTGSDVLSIPYEYTIGS